MVKWRDSWCVLLVHLVSVLAPSGAVAASPPALRAELLWRRSPAGGSCEIAAYAKPVNQLFVTVGSSVAVLELSTGESLGAIPLEAAHHATSVACSGDVAAVAWAADDKTSRGKVCFYRLPARDQIAECEVGYLPDMVTFSPDGRCLLVANEGEPTVDYGFDPVGSVSVISSDDGWQHVSCRQALFDSFAAQRAELCKQGLHLQSVGSAPGAESDFARDLEPEYIAISGDSQTAWITLQENNAIAELDIASATIRAIYPLGFKDFSRLTANGEAGRVTPTGLDVSDVDGGRRVRHWPVQGMFQPDGIACFVSGGETYLATANEGDPRDYTTYVEAVSVSHLVQVGLTVDVHNPARHLMGDDCLGRLEVSRAEGDDDQDGDLDRLVCFGTRSFSVWKVRPAGLQLCFDSGSEFEEIVGRLHPELFNIDSYPDSLPDSRSAVRGAEPENLVVFPLGRHRYAAIGLERTGGVMLYDVTRPEAATFVDYLPPAGQGATRDRAPEGLLYLAPEENSLHRALLLVCNEGSSTLSVYALNATQ